MKPRLGFAAMGLALCLGTGGCHKVVIVETPYGASFPGAEEGDNLVFAPYYPTMKGDYWVVFIDQSPCASSCYQGSADHPPQCKIVKQPSGSGKLRYSFTYSATKPTSLTCQSTRANGEISSHTRQVVQCHQCAVAVNPGSNKASAPTVSPVSSSPTDVDDHQLKITCDEDTAVAPPATVHQYSQIDWYRNGAPPGWSVTFSSATCTDLVGNPATVFGNATDSLPQSCVIPNAVVTPTAVNYSIKADDCTKKGTGQLTITPSP
jgi:hypothetical protein